MARSQELLWTRRVLGLLGWVGQALRVFQSHAVQVPRSIHGWSDRSYEPLLRIQINALQIADLIRDLPVAQGAALALLPTNVSRAVRLLNSLLRVVGVAPALLLQVVRRVVHLLPVVLE